MTIEEVQNYFTDDLNCITFTNKCYDCKKDLQIEINRNENKYTIRYGTIYFLNEKDKRGMFIKCEKCYSENNKIDDKYCSEVYPRIVDIKGKI